MKRVPFGIEGLDKLIQGGIPEGNSVLLGGTPGAGKTIISLFYIYYGAKELNEKGIYITLEEDPQDLRNQAQQFGWDFKTLEDQGMIKIIKIPIDTMNLDIFKIIGDAYFEMEETKRIVIDSLSILSINASMYKLPVKTVVEGEEHYVNDDSTINSSDKLKQFIYVFVSKVTELGATTLFIGDSPEQGDFLTRDSVSEFVCDGVIMLGVKEFGKTIVRTLQVRKMRATKAIMGYHTLEFLKDNIEIKDFDY